MTCIIDKKHYFCYKPRIFSDLTVIHYDNIMQDQSLLESFGLTRNESAVYLQLLRLSEGSAFAISKSAKMPRATAYLTLDSLKRKGLVSEYRKNNVLYFAAESPNRLMDIVERKKEIASMAIPRLHALSGTGQEQPSVKMYLGKQGIKQVFEEILDAIKRNNLHEIVCMSHPELYERLPKYFPQWVKRRSQAGPINRIILPVQAKGHSETREEGLKRKIRILPSGAEFQLTFYIYGDRLALFSFKGPEPHALVIQSPAIADAFHRLFELIWSMSSEIK